MLVVKRLILSALFSMLAVNANAGNMYVYKDKGGQVLLSNVNPSNNFDKFTKEVKVKYYLDSSAESSSLDDNYLDAGLDMVTINRWRAEAAESEAVAKKLAKKPDAAIGMTKSQVRNKTNWGDPNYIKTTTNKYGTHEQWVYDDYQYLYFDNGKLTTIQQ